MDIYKLVVRDKNGKVVQIHELYRSASLMDIIHEELDNGYTVTISKLARP